MNEHKVGFDHLTKKCAAAELADRATQLRLAEHLDLSERRVRELQDRGVLPTAAKENLDLDACRIAYIRHLRAVAAGQESENDDDADGAGTLTAARTRLANQQADHYALKNGIARRELYLATDADLAMSDVLARLRSQMLTLPARAASRIVGPSQVPAAKAQLESFVREMLEEIATIPVVGEMGLDEALADDEPDPPQGPAAGRGGKKVAEDARPAAEAQPKPMGGRARKAGGRKPV